MLFWRPGRVLAIVESFYAAISYPHGRDALLRDPAWHVSKLVFGLLPWPLTRVQRIWHLFASMDVPRRIARERAARVPTIAVGRDLHLFSYC
jgi:hypothetical protein